MPVKAYVGEPRSGKTYELASVVILNALKQGRRVLSNIAGLNFDAYVELIKAENPDIQNIGTIVNLQHDEVKKADFWLTDLTANNERHDRQIQRGDFIVLDEIWRFWDGFSRADSEGLKRPEAVLNFFRMHGQMPHPKSGLICEIALITQDLQDIHRSVKNIINQTFVTTKLTSLGISKRYRLDVFHKHYISRKPLASYQKEYNSKFFSLYKSHSAKQEGDADAVEVSTDKRGNVLNGTLIKIGLPIALVLFFFGFYFAWGFFHPKPKNEVIENVKGSAAAASNSHNPQSFQNQQTITPSGSGSWRVHGYYTVKQVLTVILVNEQGAYRYLVNPDFSIVGLDLKVVLDGQVLNNWQSFQSTKSGNLIP